MKNAHSYLYWDFHLQQPEIVSEDTFLSTFAGLGRLRGQQGEYYTAASDFISKGKIGDSFVIEDEETGLWFRAVKLGRAFVFVGEEG